MNNILKFLFLFFLYFSNISTIFTIYPILYYLLNQLNNDNKWYLYGLVFSLYELGKLVGVNLWMKLSKLKSKITLVLISISLILIINLSFCLTSHYFHIVILRFILGFSNNIGIFFKNIYIQIGFKKNNTIIVFLISIICTSLALFLPSIIIYCNLGEKLLNLSKIKLKNISLIHLILAGTNILPIIFCGILILRNKLKVDSGFYQMSNLEKTENSMDGQIKIGKNKFQEIEQKSKSKIVKVKNKNIMMINKNKIHNESDTGINKEEKSLENKVESNLNEAEKKEEIMNSNNVVILDYKKTAFLFDVKLSLLHVFIYITDGLSLIWTLIILYQKYKLDCLYISLYITSWKIVGEIILFPINQSITKNTSKLSYSRATKSISFKLKVFSLLLLLFSIGLSQVFFSYYYYYPKYSAILFKLFFVIILIKSILSGIYTQYYKIYTDKYYKKSKLKNDRLKKYNQNFGCFTKACIYAIGTFGIVIIDIVKERNNFEEILASLVYFQIVPQILYLILFITSIKI